MFRRLLAATMLCCLVCSGAAAQVRSEFFSRDLTFSLQDSDRFRPVASDASALLHLSEPNTLTLKVTKRPSSAKSLTEIAQRLTLNPPGSGKVLESRMTSVGSLLGTTLKMGPAPERLERLLTVVLREGEEYWFDIELHASEPAAAEDALALLDHIVWSSQAQAESPHLEFRSNDKAFTLHTADDFRVTYNPHAVLSLANLEEVAVVVTKSKAEHDLAQLYEGIPRSLPSGAVCQGRMMLSVGGEQAASFVIEGMFPPQGPPTHQTLMAVVVRGDAQYDFMIHYPIEVGTGLEDAHALLSSVVWRPSEK